MGIGRLDRLGLAQDSGFQAIGTAIAIATAAAAMKCFMDGN